MAGNRSAAALPVETVGPEGIWHCGIGCITNVNHTGYRQKIEWLQRRFLEGLRYLLVRDERGKPLGFLEYVPGEHAWRPVDAGGWLFVHCLWVYPAGQKVGGLGTRLIQAVIDHARRAGSTGVAAVVSDGPWMAGKAVFLKNGFREIAEAGRFQLVVHRLREGVEVRFRDISRSMARYRRGLHLVYAPQCPMFPTSVNDVSRMAAEHGIALNVRILRSAREAQRAPSYYGVYNLIWNGELLSDHYVSKGRFNNLLRKLA